MTDQARIKPKKVGNLIISRFPLDSCKDFYTCIIEAIRELAPELDDLELYTTADRIQGSVRSVIDAHIEEYRERNLPPRVYWSELNPDRLIGRSFTFKNDNPEEKTFKQKLRLIEKVQNAVANLSWEDFERFCCKFLSQEPRFTRVRRRRHNGGIDYYGTYIISETHRIPFAGQAKKYGINRKIGPNIVRELAGAMRAGRWAFGVIMATCGFTKGARKTGRKNNIDLIDGEQISFRLIKMNIGIIDNGHPTFSEEDFRSWLRR
jgi:restriction endonuclease Mrr